MSEGGRRRSRRRAVGAVRSPQARRAGAGAGAAVRRKTMEVEILKEALDLARAKKPTLLSRLPTREDTQ